MENTKSLITVMTVLVLDSSLCINLRSGWRADPKYTMMAAPQLPGLPAASLRGTDCLNANIYLL